MSDFTSLSVNKNSTRFAPKVKARPGARRTQNNKDNKESKESQDISTIQRRKSSISKPLQKDHKSIRSIDTQVESTINNNEFDQEAPSTPIPTKKNISKVVKKTETIITTTTTTTTAITSISNTKLKAPIVTLDTPNVTYDLSDSTTIPTKQTAESNNPLNNNDKEESLKKMNEVQQQQQQQQQQQPRLKRLPSLTKASAMDSDHKDNNNNNNNTNATITTIKKSKTLDTLKAAMNKSMTKEPTNGNNIPSIKSAAKSKTKTIQPVGKKITTPGSSGSGISFSVPSNNNIKSIPPLSTVPPTIIATPKNNNVKPKKKEQNMMDIENITTQPLSATKVRKDNEEDDNDHTDISDDESDDASKKRKLQEIQNKSKNKRMKLRSHRIREKPIVTAAAEFQGSDVDDEEDEEVDNEEEEEEELEENDQGERDEHDENGDDEMNDKAYRTNKEKVYKEKRKIISPTTKEKQMSKKKKKATTINTATSTAAKKKSIKKNMKVSDMKILEEINFDPLQPEDLDKPVAFFIQDLQRGIVTKSYRDERILHEEEVAKKSNNEEVAKALQKRREEAEQLNEQKRLQLEQERQRQQQQEKDKRNNGLTESQHALQVRLVDGKIVLDTDSMLIDRREEHEKISHEHMEVVEENSNTRKVNAYTYGKKSKSARWSKAETELFYQLLSQFGTDFEMISKMIPNRSRAQLRLKFIREERADPDKITEHLIRKKQPVNLEKFKSVTGLEFEDVPDHFLDIKII